MKRIIALLKKLNKLELLMVFVGVMVAITGTKIGVAKLRSESVSLIEKLTCWVPLGVLFWFGAVKALESLWSQIQQPISGGSTGLIGQNKWPRTGERVGHLVYSISGWQRRKTFF